MKRVLNSGSITLTNILGSEEGFLTKYLEYYGDEKQAVKHSMQGIYLTFQIKAPLLILQTIQKSNLGHLESFEVLDASEAYLPPFFWKQGASELIQMSPAECNELNTKYSNFYRNVTNFYFKLINQGVSVYQASLVLPQGTFTTFNWEIDMKALVEFIELNKDKSPELVGYCSNFMLYLQENFPNTVKWLRQNNQLL